MSGVFFCKQTGVRIAGPGVSKTVDPVNGHDDFSEAPAGSETKPEKGSKQKPAPGAEKPAAETPSTPPPPPAPAGSETKPEKGSK